MLFSPKTRALGALATIGLAATLVSCSADTGTNGGSGDANNDLVSVDPTFPEVAEAVALLPDNITESGVVRVAIPTNEPPTQFYREGTQEMTGINPDIARLIAGALGVELQIEVTNFDSIIPGIEADRYDFTVSSMTPTEERMKALDFVEYMNVGNGLATKTGNPQNLDMQSLCEKQVAVLTGSYQLTVNIPDMDAACEADGLGPIVIQQFQDTRQAINSMVSDRSDAVFADGPILGYAAIQNPDIELAVEEGFDPVAVGLGKDNGMLDAVKVALDEILLSDEYQAVLDAYGVGGMAITDAKVNVPQ